MSSHQGAIPSASGLSSRQLRPRNRAVLAPEGLRFSYSSLEVLLNIPMQLHLHRQYLVFMREFRRPLYMNQ